MGSDGTSSRGGGGFDPAAFRLEVQKAVAAHQASFIDPLDRMAGQVSRDVWWCSAALLITGLAGDVVAWAESPWAQGFAFAALAGGAALALSSALNAAIVCFIKRCELREAVQMKDAVSGYVLPKEAEVAMWRMRSFGRRDFRLGFRGLILAERVRFLLNRKLMVRQLMARRQWGWTEGVFLAAMALATAFDAASAAVLANAGAGELGPLVAAAALGLVSLAAVLTYLWSRALTKRVTATLEPEPDEVFDRTDTLGAIEAWGVKLLTRLHQHEAFIRAPDDEDDDAEPPPDGR